MEEKCSEKEVLILYRFTNDYSEGAHPDVLAALEATNVEGNFGYGCDGHCERAAARIRELCGAPEADVHFLVGGTQANLTAVAAFLRPHEAVIAAETGHVCVHETGAIEATGHKCVAMPSRDGKLTPDAVRAACAAHPDEHMVKPRLVYVSNTTEIGTVYTEAELAALHDACGELGLYLYLDGARLGSAVAAGGADFRTLARLCDAFTIGGTKNGALFGEALVITNDALKPDFRWILKQHGGMLAKGWLLGAQFEALLANDLYLSLARHENALALRLRDGIAALGYAFSSESPSNQQFPVLPDTVLDKMRGEFHWEEMGSPAPGMTNIRLVTSWATKPEAVDAFLARLTELTTR